MTTHSTDYSPSYPATGQAGSSQTDTPMKERASEAVEQGREAAGNVAQTAVEHASEVKDEAVQQARDLVAEARSHVTRQVGDQHHNLVTNLRSLSEELGSMVQGSQQSGTATEIVSQARQRVSGAADWLEGRQPGEILDELRTFARRRPGTFLLGALAAGVVVGRLTRGAVASHTEDTSDAAPGSVHGHNGSSGYSMGGAYGTPPATQSLAPEPGPVVGGGYAAPADPYDPASGYGSPGGYGNPGGYGPAGGETGYGTTTEYGDPGSYGQPR